MKSSIGMPCSAWAEKLAARHPDDLPPADRAALEKHLQSCSACAAAHTAYSFMESSIRALPPVEPLQVLPSQLLQEEANLTEYNRLDSGVTAKGGVSNRFLQLKKRDRISFTPRLSQVMRQVNMLAAILIVSCIILSAVLLFTNRHATTIGITSTPPATVQVPPNCSLYVDAGLQQVCRSNLYESVQLTKIIGDYTLTIERVYADSNRIVIEYSVMKTTDHTYFPAELTATLTTQQGIILPGTGWIVAKGPVGMQTMIFDAASLPENTRELRLHLKVDSFRTIVDQSYGSSQGPGPTSFVSGPVSFDFSVAFYPGYITNVNQTVTLNGIRLTLERVVVTPSQVRFYLQGNRSIFKGVPGRTTQPTRDDFALSVGGKSYGVDELTNAPQNYAVTLSVNHWLLDKVREWTILWVPGPFGHPFVFQFAFLSINGSYQGPFYHP